MMSKLYRRFIDCCNEEMGIILRCIARKFSPQDLVSEKGHSVVCLWHNDFTFRGMIYQYRDTGDYCLVGLMVSSKYTNYSSMFCMDMEALNWPEFWLSNNPEEQVISYNDGIIGGLTRNKALTVIQRACPDIVERPKIIDAVIDPMVHSDDDLHFVTEDEDVRGKVNVRIYESSDDDFLHMGEILFFPWTKLTFA